ncbi:flagellar basal-body rod protein FlgB [Keratinibaculum paraultunense]|uniref:Flagellar basal body rod protein FlgB n=1 Tax=Keratinibaculum paraultunense TaxID=1278232 RepID=A0A4R3KVJ3_9FIRM|nr:flagellar basal body rod protein FlgB [Keratinibaculum paraultunense]QQY80743.1 flagellar basal body rod protein FlgB [Keratinibaculum paraultunense]TCS89649.1 flagellar basal-body rod protein FlgB [Keratinibaculum paraultunense]
MLKQFYNDINILNKALDGIWLRNKAINHNIANVDTPKYKRLSVNFEDKLKEAIDKQESKLVRTHHKHLPITKNVEDIEPEITVDRNFSYRFDKNSVDIDIEATNLAKNTIMYNALVDQTIDEFDRVKNVISEGSRY